MESRITHIVAPTITRLGRHIEKKRFSAPPIYIGGCGRSGTTLLLSILSAHNDIFACPRELNLFEGAEDTDQGLSVPKLYRLYRTFIREKIKPTANRYCEKSPSNIRHIGMINRLHYGNFKMIQIVRDGRDVILSRHPRNPEAYWISPDRWIKDVTIGLGYLEHPNVHTIRYEDLVSDFKGTIRGVCDFLKITLSDEILNWHDHATVQNNKALYTPIQQINDASVGKWKNEEQKVRVRQLTDLPEAMVLLKKMKYT